MQIFDDQAPTMDRARAMNCAWKNTYALIEALCVAEQNGWPKETLSEQLKTIASLHAKSPFLTRLREWPRGYPGDFQTIEMLYRQENSSDPATGAWFIEQIALASPMAQQHRNKIEFQRRLVDNCILEAKRAGAPRIASIACGGSIDLQESAINRTGRSAVVYLLDVDDEALRVSRERIESTKTQVVAFHGDVLRTSRQLRQSEPFDLILVGGLMDYLPERQAIFLMKTLARCLGPDGLLYASNIQTDNPYQAWLENVANWKMIYRSQADLRRVFAYAGFPDSSVNVELEPSGLTLLARATATSW